MSDIEKNICWPELYGQDRELVNYLNEMGYIIQEKDHSWSSVYEIKTKEGVLTEDVLEQIEKDIEKAKLCREYEAVNEMFEKNAFDEDGIFSFISLGGAPENPSHYDMQKYVEMGVWCISHKGPFRSHTHTKGYVLCHKERFEDNQKKVIVFRDEQSVFSSSESDKTLAGLCDISAKNGIYFKIVSPKNGFLYIVDGKVLKKSFSFDFDLNDDKAVLELLARENLHWPYIGGEQFKAAEMLKKMGYNVVRVGNSGFSNRNIYSIRTDDGIITEEVCSKINDDVEKVYMIIREEKHKAFEECFCNTSSDNNGCYAVIETGGDSWEERIPSKKYIEIVRIKTGNTKDYRRNRDHTYLTLFFDEEKMKADKRKFVILYVPKDMIGKVIGPKGVLIKELQQKYGKFFKVEQDPREIKAERIAFIKNKFSDLLREKGAMGVLEGMDLSLQDEVGFSDLDKEALQDYFRKALDVYEKEQEEKRIRQRKEDLTKLKNNILESFGDEFISMKDEEIVQASNLYLRENADKITVVPNEEEFGLMVGNMQEIKEARISVHKQVVKSYVQSMISYVREQEEKNKTEISFEDLEAYVRSEEGNYNDEKARTDAYDEVVEVLTKKRTDKKRLELADERFDDVAYEVMSDFFSSDFVEPHGCNYFSCVGKNRRNIGYEIITKNVFEALGILDLATEEVSYGVVYSEQFKNYKEKIISKISTNDSENSYFSSYFSAYFVMGESEETEEIDEVCIDEPIEMTKEEKEAVKQKLKEAKKAYGKGAKMKTLKGGLDGLKALLDNDRAK